MARSNTSMPVAQNTSRSTSAKEILPLLSTGSPECPLPAPIPVDESGYPLVDRTAGAAVVLWRASNRLRSASHGVAAGLRARSNTHINEVCHGHCLEIAPARLGLRLSRSPYRRYRLQRNKQ